MNVHFTTAVCLAFAAASLAADPAPPANANELASRLSAIQQDGATYVRLKMEISGGKKETLQLQIKQRRTKHATEVVYQVLFPKERKGESVLVRKVGSRAASGSVFVPPATVRAIDDLTAPLFGGDLSYEDLVEDCYAWAQQALVGTEEVDGVACQILESKPGGSGRSSYSRVRSWIDLRRLVPLRIEKYTGSQLVRRIDTTRVVTDAGHAIPANLLVRRSGSGTATALDGSRIKHDVTYPDREFTAEGLGEIAPPRGE